MRKLAIHIGASVFVPEPYRGDPPRALPAAVGDARNLADLTREAGFIGTTIAGERAARQAVIDALAYARDNLHAGDLLVVTFSGHGALHSDAPRTSPMARPLGANNRYPRDEAGEFDQSWCLHDGVLIDDDLHDCLAEFRRGVRIHVLSDSCYSGDILRDPDAALAKAAANAAPDELLRGLAVRDGTDVKPRPTVEASVLLSAGATLDGMAGGNQANGLFAHAVVQLWDHGAFPGDHHAFQAALQEALRGQPVPALKAYGADDPAFPLMRPFGAPGPARR